MERMVQPWHSCSQVVMDPPSPVQLGMWHLGVWATGGIVSAGGAAGLDLKGLFQPKQFMIF